MNRKKLKLKINADGLAKGIKKGDVITIDVDEHNTPFDFFWFRRLRDSRLDNCVQIVEERKESKRSKSEDITNDSE